MLLLSFGFWSRVPVTTRFRWNRCWVSRIRGLGRMFVWPHYFPRLTYYLSVGFDYTYDKQLLDKLGSGQIDDISNWITSNSVSFVTHSAHCKFLHHGGILVYSFTIHRTIPWIITCLVDISNHDEPRAVAYFGSWPRSDGAAFITFTLPGLRFYWMGMFEGYANKLDVHLRS